MGCPGEGGEGEIHSCGCQSMAVPPPNRSIQSQRGLFDRSGGGGCQWCSCGAQTPARRGGGPPSLARFCSCSSCCTRLAPRACCVTRNTRRWGKRCARRGARGRQGNRLAFTPPPSPGGALQFAAGTLLSSLTTGDGGGGADGGDLRSGGSDCADSGGGSSGRPPTSAKALRHKQLNPDAEARCQGVKGSWCGHFWMQQPEARKPPPRGNRTCLWGLDGNVCNFAGAARGRSARAHVCTASHACHAGRLDECCKPLAPPQASMPARPPSRSRQGVCARAPTCRRVPWHTGVVPVPGRVARRRLLHAVQGEARCLAGGGMREGGVPARVLARFGATLRRDAGASAMHRPLLQRPCSQFKRESPGFEPYDEPVNWREGRKTLGCAGFCDKGEVMAGGGGGVFDRGGVRACAPRPRVPHPPCRHCPARHRDMLL